MPRGCLEDTQKIAWMFNPAQGLCHTALRQKCYIRTRFGTLLSREHCSGTSVPLNAARRAFATASLRCQTVRTPPPRAGTGRDPVRNSAGRRPEARHPSIRNLIRVRHAFFICAFFAPCPCGAAECRRQPTCQLSHLASTLRLTTSTEFLFKACCCNVTAARFY